jgi:RNA polymerase sigma-54 factor
MELGLRANLEQKQQLRMTPQLQQAIKLLQLSRMELKSLVRQEMVENPVLEEQQDPYAAESMYVKEHGIDQKADENPDQVDEVQADERDMDNIDWEEYLDDYSSRSMPTNSYKGYSTTELPGYEETLSTEESLTEHLMSQLRLSALDERQQEIGALIIGNLDDAGYLREASIEEIAEDAEADPEEVKEVLEIVQEFDPVGIAARDLQECLKIQAEVYYPDDETVHQIIADHISDLERKSTSKIARVLNLDKEEVRRAAKVISAMEPRPGGSYDVMPNENEAQYITPDIYIFKDSGEWVATLNEDGLPKLKVSDYYRKQLAKKKEEGDDDEVKEYIQEKLRGAMWLIRSIHQRQSTIMKVTESIIKHQKAFFEEGIHKLKPMVLKDVAEDIEMHESTVSRVTTNKYVHTPRGVFELKFFFNSSISCTDGQDLASEAVKARIRDIIEQEDPGSPLSDAKIADRLEEEDNIDIARRTVAKYREKMGILSSTKRKKAF